MSLAVFFGLMFSSPLYIGAALIISVAIIAYNINGIRSAIAKGFWEWLAQESPDIICLQETKAQPHDVPLLELEALGIATFFIRQKKRGTAGWRLFPKKRLITLYSVVIWSNTTGKAVSCAPISATGAC